MSLLNTNIIMSKNINLDRDYKNVTNQDTTSFLALMRDSNHLVYASDTYSFINYTDNVIRVNCTYNQAVQTNYIAFQNTLYNNKWFFAFVDEVRYRSDRNCEIYYTIDAFRTFFNDLTLNDCFVIREHTNDDTIGANTIQEDINTGEYIQIGDDISISQLNDYYLCMDTTYDAPSQQDFVGTYIYNGIYSGYKTFLFNNTIDGANSCLYFILFTQAMKSNTDSILNLYMLPKAMFQENSITAKKVEFTLGSDKRTANYLEITTDTTTATTLSYNIPKVTSFSDLQIKNNKCYVYPYNYLYVTNNSGNFNTYKYEEFYNNENASFTIPMAIGVGGSGLVSPINYQNKTINEDEGVPLPKYPTCTWNSDSSVNWLMSQAVNSGTQYLGLMLQSAGAGLGADSTYQASRYRLKRYSDQSHNAPLFNTESVGNAVGSLLPILSTELVNKIGAFYQASLLPNVVQGGNTANALFSANRSTIIFRRMRCKNENMQVIDDYFTKYGYKTLRLKKPNVNGRQFFNYIEIEGGSNIGHGNVPADYLDEINTACRRGVTIWHNHSYIGNYDVNNNIV